ncbi:OLC1v1034799C1 [Oldenlandia corymbosa var. corymbosa]|uniref:OLC1v1034799C1 n=1 Tax=Oldenlandia corymbosa var. corymbosa TaxID=529605 RepID=A0AAV1CT65_OLDCO|nr:OLC1v1034799C1 [Oldenlandia corymbosa var. corymbosa]
MSFTFFNSVLQTLSPRWPLFLYAFTWTVILTVLVAVASFSPELAFVSAITPTSAFSEPCRRDRESQGGAMTVRVPLDIPGEAFCIPAHLFRRSKLDLLVPPVFAAVIVATSAYVVKAVGLWETDDPRD